MKNDCDPFGWLRVKSSGRNRRIKTHVNSASAADNTYDEFCHFFYNNRWQVLETRVTSSENTQPEDATVKPQWQFVWSQRYIDASVCRDENKDGDGDCTSGSAERLYYLTDANMNVTTLTDTAGDAVERYAYDPYGAVTIDDATWSNTRSTSSYGNTVLFAGYWRDSATGLYHVRNRTYHAQLGRWVQRDPAGYMDGMSLYEYVRSNTSLPGPMGLTKAYLTSMHAAVMDYDWFTDDDVVVSFVYKLSLDCNDKGNPFIVGEHTQGPTLVENHWGNAAVKVPTIIPVTCSGGRKGLDIYWGGTASDGDCNALEGCSVGGAVTGFALGGVPGIAIGTGIGAIGEMADTEATWDFTFHICVCCDKLDKTSSCGSVYMIEPVLRKYQESYEDNDWWDLYVSHD